MKMKKSIIYITAVLTLSIASSCDKGFDNLNINRTAATAINPIFTLNNATVNLSYATGTLIYEEGIVQQMITPNSGVLTGANFNQDNRDNTAQNWQKYYRTVIRNTQDVIKQTSALPARSNLFNMAKILQAYSFMVLTDSYGDVPYAEAGKGYSDQIILPKYESQQTIYAGIIKDLTDASVALDATKTVETADVLYSGNVALWKKFANSLLLRAGMRLSKVDPAQAQAIVSKVATAGVMDANTDNALIKHDANYVNAVGNLLNSTEAANFYMATPFVDFLKKTNDPRLKSIAVRYVGAKSGPDMVAAKASTDPTVQVGFPLGFDNTTIAAKVTENKLASFYDFTQVDRARLAKNTAPCFIVTAAQTQLLLAEAAQRGWVTGSTAEAYYKKGIKLHMEQLGTVDAGSAITTAVIDAYLTENLFDTATALEQINTQYWVASFLNGPEVFANFRRSGFPVLSPNPFPGKSIKGTFIKRLTYPNSEISVNKTNVDAAITRQGADDLDTKVWWDK
jgi:Starch-binding associating with outer membrane